MMPGNLGWNIKCVVVKSHSRKPGGVISNCPTDREPGLNVGETAKNKWVESQC